MIPEQAASAWICTGCGEKNPSWCKCINDAVDNRYPEAVWNAMSDTEKVEFLATEIMGWHRVVARGRKLRKDVYIWATQDRDQDKHWDFAEEDDWNPLTSWDHWRQVELRIMQDEGIWGEFMSQFPFLIEKSYMEADLPLRAKALYLSYQATR